MDNDEREFYYDREMFFKELSQSIERKQLSTNALFTSYLNDFKEIVQYNGLVQEEMKIICQLLCKVDLSVLNVKRILLTFVPEEPSIPSDICEELIVLILSIYHRNTNDTKKAQCMLYWLLYVVEEKLSDINVIDKYYKILFHLCNNGILIQPISGIIYSLTKSDDVQEWMITSFKTARNSYKTQLKLEILINLFENPNTISETRQKGLFDNNTKFCKEMACGLRSVRKELTHLHPQTANSLQLTKYNRRSSDGLVSKLQIINLKKKFQLPSSYDAARTFVKENVSHNSLSLLSNVSGWIHLQTNTDEKINLQLRFTTNLHNYLNQIFFSNEINLTPIKKLKFLQEILDYQKFAQRGLTAVTKFIFKFLLSWDGIESARVIYELFEYLSFTSEEELKDSFIEKLFAIFITGDELVYRMVINSLTNLLCNLHLNSKRTKSSKNCVLFGEQLRTEEEFEIVKCLTKYISHWCSLCIYHYPQDEQLKNTVYTFFEKVSVLENLMPQVWPLWTIMPPNVFYDGLMSINIFWLDRLAKLMLRYIDNDMDRIEEFSDTSWIAKSSNMFNLYMADLFNGLQTGKLVEKREEGFIFKKFSREDIQKELNLVNLNTCFQLKNHIALAPYFMKSGNPIENPLELLETEAPNLYNLIQSLIQHLEDDGNISSVY